jgi:hypothetical protein
VAGLREGADEMTADEAASAGDDYAELDPRSSTSSSPRDGNFAATRYSDRGEEDWVAVLCIR